MGIRHYRKNASETVNHDSLVIKELYIVWIYMAKYVPLLGHQLI